MFHANHFQWKVELEEILEIALEDSDQWVSMVAELLKKYPMNGTINFDIQENSTVFTDLVSELKKLGMSYKLLFNPCGLMQMLILLNS